MNLLKIIPVHQCIFMINVSKKRNRFNYYQKTLFVSDFIIYLTCMMDRITLQILVNLNIPLTLVVECLFHF